MKLQVFFTFLVVGLAVQSNGVDAVLWQFLTPFLQNGFIFSSQSAGSSNSTPGSTIMMSVSGLNNSNAILNAGTGSGPMTSSITQTINPAPAPAEAAAASGRR